MTSGPLRWERVGPVRWSVGSDTAIVVVDGRLEPFDAAPVSAALHLGLSRSGVGYLVCRGAGLVDPDLATVDLLARLRLVACRSGWEMRVEAARRNYAVRAAQTTSAMPTRSSVNDDEQLTALFNRTCRDGPRGTLRRTAPASPACDYVSFDHPQRRATTSRHPRIRLLPFPTGAHPCAGLRGMGRAGEPPGDIRCSQMLVDGNASSGMSRCWVVRAIRVRAGGEGRGRRGFPSVR